MQPARDHHYDDARCACGGEWVYFDDEGTHGCEVAGPYVAVPIGLPLDHVGRAVCAGCGTTTDGVARCAARGALCDECSLEWPCDACASR